MSKKNSKQLLAALCILVFIVSFASLFIPQAHASLGITLVQSAHAQETGAATGYCIFSTAPTAGDVIVLTVGLRTTVSTTVSSVSETGVSWTVAVNSVSAGNYLACICYGVVGSGAGAVISVFPSDTSYYGCVMDASEFSDLSSTPLDVYASNTGAGTTTDTGTTVTTSTPNELFVGDSVTGSQTQSSATNGFSVIGGTPFDSGYVCSAFLYKIVSSTQTANSGCQISGASWSGAIATFEATAPAPTPTLTPTPTPTPTASPTPTPTPTPVASSRPSPASSPVGGSGYEGFGSTPNPINPNPSNPVPTSTPSPSLPEPRQSLNDGVLLFVVLVAVSVAVAMFFGRKR